VLQEGNFLFRIFDFGFTPPLSVSPQTALMPHQPWRHRWWYGISQQKSHPFPWWLDISSWFLALDSKANSHFDLSSAVCASPTACI